jgi:hypothetical protein
MMANDLPPTGADSRRVWPSDAPGLKPHSEPEVRARPATDAEVPSAARRVIALAGAHGWTAEALYARGNPVGARGQALAIVDQIIVILRREPRRAVAIWTNGSFDCAWARGHGRVGARALREAIVGLSAGPSEPA